jgi:hypothetical protein
MAKSQYSTSIESVVVDTDVGSSDPIDYSDFTSGMFHIPTGSTYDALTWYVSTKIDGEYLPAVDVDGNAVTMITLVDGMAYQIPVALSGARFIKVVGNDSGVFGVTLKAEKKICSASIESIVVSQDVDSSDPIHYCDFVSGIIFIPQGTLIGTAAWYVSTKIDGEYLPAYDSAGVAVVIQ